MVMLREGGKGSNGGAGEGVVGGVGEAEVVGGNGSCGFMPAALQCSSKEATVFFFGLLTPRPKCLALSWASSI